MITPPVRNTKYYPLYEHLKDQAEAGRPYIMLTFYEVERIIKAQLPKSAYKPDARSHFWQNDFGPTIGQTHMISRAWLAAGWRAEANVEQQWVEFSR